MQTHDFEKHVQKELAEFSLEPTDGVWQNVELRINRERKKRRIVFFWLFAGIVLLGGAGLLYVNSNDDGRNIAHVEKSNSNFINEEKELGSKPEIVKPEEANGTSVIADSDQAESESVNKAAKKANIEQQQRTLRGSTKRTSTWISNDQNKPRQNIPGLEKFGKSSSIIHKAGRKTGSDGYPGNEMNATSKRMESMVDLSSEPALNSTIETQVIANNKNMKEATPRVDSVKSTDAVAGPKNTTVDSSIATMQQKKSFKKSWSYGLTSMIGVSDIFSGFNSMSSPAPVRTGSLSSTTVTNSVPQLSLNFRSSIAFGIGVFAQSSFTNKLAMDFGVAYQFQSTRSSVGSLNSFGGSFYDSALAKQATVAAYYNAGDNVKYTNRYHFIQLPINLLWQLNKSAERPLALFGGVTPGYLMQSNAIYANYRQGVYYQEKEQFNKFQLSGQLGMLFTVKNAGKYNLQLGPVAQYDFTSLTKSIISPTQHLIFLGFKSKLTIK